MNFENLGFSFETSGFEVNPTFLSGSEAQGMQLLFCIVSRIWHNLAVCMSLLPASSLTRGNLSFCSQFDHRCYAFAGVGWWGREGC